MKKLTVLLPIVLTLFLCGCAVREADGSYPSYFEPIVRQLEISKQATDTGTLRRALCDEGITDRIEFDLKPYIKDSEEENWSVAGTFQLEDRTYQCWYDTLRWFEVSAQKKDKKDVPQIILVEYEDLKVKQVTPYIMEPEGSFSWYCGCYRIGEKLYLADQEDNRLAVIDLDSGELRYCEEELAATEKFAEEIIGEASYGMYFFRAIWEQEDVTVYSAEISEGNDCPPVGMIFVAVEKGKPIDYMSVDLNAIEITVK